jgi:glycosyltransferase involved in cell wall biosynthesis
MRFSIIIATLNSAGCLRNCLDSIAAQTCLDYETLVVDGGSTDGTQAIVSHFAPRLAWFVSEPDGGIYEAWNKALLHARGEWICFPGADDALWDERVLGDYGAFLVRMAEDDRARP